MIIARAPARISFAGGGTDLAAYYRPFGGVVVSAAIGRYACVMAAEPADGRIRISSADYGLALEYDRGVRPVVEQPLALPKAALDWFYDRGLRERGVELTLSSQLPPGTGLGSSSAMAVALVRALAAYQGMAMGAAGAAELACAIEIDRLGMPIGKQDQYASACGGINTLVFAAGGVQVERLELPHATIAGLDARLLLFSTGRQRDSAAILRQQRRDSATNQSVIESLHRIKALALEARAALLAGDLDTFGRLLDEGWQAKRGLSRRISSSAIDRWYAEARAAGAVGGKIAGAGGGGFLLLFCPPERQAGLRLAMARCGLEELPFGFDLRGACVEESAGEMLLAREVGIPERASLHY